MPDTKTSSNSGNDRARDEDGRFTDKDSKSSSKSGGSQAQQSKSKDDDRGSSRGSSDDHRSKSR